MQLCEFTPPDKVKVMQLIMEYFNQIPIQLISIRKYTLLTILNVYIALRCIEITKFWN